LDWLEALGQRAPRLLGTAVVILIESGDSLPLSGRGKLPHLFWRQRRYDSLKSIIRGRVRKPQILMAQEDNPAWLRVHLSSIARYPQHLSRGSEFWNRSVVLISNATV